MRARGNLKTTLFAGNSDPEKKIWIESSPTSDQKFQNWANDGILIQLPEARSYIMDLLETAYQKLDEVRAHLYQKTVPVRTAATASHPLPYSNTRHFQERDQHSIHCGVKLLGFRQPCSCFHGSMTFSNAQCFVDSLFVRPRESKFVKTINDIPQTTSIGIQNLEAMFGLRGSKGALVAAFGTGDGPGGRDDNVLFGTNGVISRTLTHWESVIRDLFDLVDKLRAELVKMREEMERERDEMKRQREEIEQAKLAAEQKATAEAAAATLKAQAEVEAAEQKAQARVAAAEQKASGLQDRLSAAQEALRTAESSRKFAKALRAQRSHDIGPMGRLQRWRVPANRTGLTAQPLIKLSSDPYPCPSSEIFWRMYIH